MIYNNWLFHPFIRVIFLCKNTLFLQNSVILSKNLRCYTLIGVICVTRMEKQVIKMGRVKILARPEIYEMLFLTDG